MTPSAWIALASLAAVLFVQTAVVAFALGRLFQRVTTVEKASDSMAVLADKVTRLSVQMEHMEGGVSKLGREMEGVNRQLGNLAMGHLGRGVEISP
ncbi:MAG: hypothetical protein ACRED4_07030 [Brevundimonas sp.]